MRGSSRSIFYGRDGLPLACYEVGEGRPLILFHGFAETASQSWIAGGHASMLAEQGRRVIMPDLRGHGQSSRPHEAEAYPADVLTEDGLALIEHLGLEDYDLCGYSLGARVVLRMLIRGAAPGRAVLGGQGLAIVTRETRRTVLYRHLLGNFGKFERDTREWKMESGIKQNGGDPVALLHVLDTFVDVSLDTLAQIQVPVLVAVGDEDSQHASAARLAAALPRGRHLILPGNHVGAFAAFVAAAAEFLGGGL